MKYVVLIAWGLTLLASPQKKDEPELWLQQAMQTETVDGDLKSAVEQYKKVIARQGAGREVVAKALVRLGECYEKQGSVEARKQYERVVREFSDQSEAAREARGRLSAARVAQPSGMTVRRIWMEPGSPGQISRDGRYFSYVSSKSDLAVLDLTSGEKRTIAQPRADENMSGGHNSHWSPDGKRLAYGLNDQHEVRTIGVDGADMRTVFRTTGDELIFPRDWSPDGRRILAVRVKWRRASGFDTVSLVWLNASDGSAETITTGPGTFNFRAHVSPDGRYIAIGPARVANGVREVHLIASDGSGEVTLSAHPAGEFPVGWSPDGRYVLFFSMRAKTTGLWAIPVADGKAQGEPQLLRRDLGDKAQPHGITRSGAFHYSVHDNNVEVWAIENFLPSVK